MATSASDERGFALALVVLLLFAIGVAGATGYQVVRTEAQLALQTHEGIQALAIARAGLQWFVAEEVGQPADTMVYVLNGGEALVSSRKLYDLPTIPDELYVITSVGSYADPRAETTPATRTVRQYAVWRGSPMNRIGALIALSGNVHVESDAEVDGSDNSSCGVDVYGIAYVDGLTADGEVVGSPDPAFPYADSAALATALDLSWDLLRDPAFPVGEFDGAWPDFNALPADSFPLVRVSGDFDASGTGGTGCLAETPNASACRGALIVTGAFEPSRNFTWNGIVLAGDFRNATGPPGLRDFFVNGILVAGLDGSTNNIRIQRNSAIRYHFCDALASGRSLAHLELVDGTWSEGM